MMLKSKLAPLAGAPQPFDQILHQAGQVIFGKGTEIRLAVACLLANGHLLIEDLPGMGKTTLAHTLARLLGLQFSRIQFTSDLLPSDVTGVAIYDETVKEFVFKKGPVFANIVLADEINRATPKTQSALLEVMDRARVTIDGEAHAVGQPFMVFATQNPVDYEGTFPLPESQMDRFLLRLHMGYPSERDELEILRQARLGYDAIAPNPVVTRSEVAQWQALAAKVFVEESVLDFLLKIVTATRTETAFRAGVSVRGGLALKAAAQARALLQGRDFVIPEDVTSLAPVVLAHRLVPAHAPGDALESRRVVEAALRQIVSRLPNPA